MGWSRPGFPPAARTPASPSAPPGQGVAAITQRGRALGPPGRMTERPRQRHLLLQRLVRCGAVDVIEVMISLALARPPLQIHQQFVEPRTSRSGTAGPPWGGVISIWPSTRFKMTATATCSAGGLSWSAAGAASGTSALRRGVRSGQRRRPGRGPAGAAGRARRRLLKLVRHHGGLLRHSDGLLPHSGRTGAWPPPDRHPSRQCRLRRLVGPVGGDPTRCLVGAGWGAGPCRRHQVDGVGGGDDQGGGQR